MHNFTFETCISSVLFFALLQAKYVSSEENSSLVLLQIVHRHGDRTPIDFYPTDPYGKAEQWVDGLGELTPRGKDRMYKYGQQLRSRYDHYLGDSPKNIYVRSSPSDRCLESAAALLSGLYPPKGRWIWSEDILALFWQPIAIQTVNKTNDGLLVPSSYCPAADAAYQEIMHSKPVLDFMASQRDFIAKVEAKTGQNLSTLRQMDYLYDSINAEITFDDPKPIPKWITELGNDTLDRLKLFETNAFKWDWSSKTVQRLRSGLLFQELTNNMRKVSDGQKDLKKVYLYSTHDTVIVTALQALGLYSGISPSYGSSLIFELHRIDGQHFVHLFYANVTPVLTYNQLGLKNCGSTPTEKYCELNGFVKSVSEFIPTDWHKECQIETEEYVGSGVQRFDQKFTLKTKEFKEKKSSNETKWTKSGNIWLIFIGFLTGISTLFVLKAIKVLLNKTLNQTPNRNLYSANSYSVNHRFKNKDIYKI